jgi:hypothetical protein
MTATDAGAYVAHASPDAGIAHTETRGGGDDERHTHIRPHRYPCNACIRQHALAYVSIRQHTSAYVCIRLHTYGRTDIHAMPAYVSMR